MTKQLKAVGYAELIGNREGVNYGMVLTKLGRTELSKIAAKVLKQNQ